MLTVIGTMTYLAIGEGQSSLTLELSENNLAAVEGCVEDLLQKVHDDAGFAAASLTHTDITCLYTYNSGGPSDWDVTVNAPAGSFARKTRVVFTRSSEALTVTSWQEI